MHERCMKDRKLENEKSVKETKFENMKGTTFRKWSNYYEIINKLIDLMITKTYY